ncbi:MAG TPA: hypothetical protein VFB31_15085 [Pseudolabrys sp.]|nr:hypothetical protein [Pseudolabrys sp.]
MPAQFWLKLAAVWRRPMPWRYRPPAQILRRRLFSALVVGAAVAATSVGAVQAFHTERHGDDGPQGVAPLADVIAFVQRRGWSVDLAYLCKGLSLTEAGNKCLFRQIAMHSKTAELDDHGLNVPVDESPPSRLVLYHVTPLAGEFFLASIDGKLITAAVRARGTDFIPMPGERAGAALKAELAFWQGNFPEIERAVLSGQMNAAPLPRQLQ